MSETHPPLPPLLHVNLLEQVREPEEATLHGDDRDGLARTIPAQGCAGGSDYPPLRAS